MTKPFTAATLFSGGGIAEIGMTDLVQMVGAVEFDPAIAAHYKSVWGDHITCADVADVDYKQFAGIDWGHASPSCRNASLANSNGGETEGDIASGLAVERFIEQARPRVFTLENVRGYAAFTAFEGICRKLTECGYRWDTQILNSADFGVPQTRTRLFIRAWLSPDPLPRIEPTHAERGKIARSAAHRGLFDDAPLLPWNGWYAAIEDLIPTLPESKFADWQMKRLENSPVVGHLLAHGTADNDRFPTCAEKDPSFTVLTGTTRHPAFIVDGQETVPDGAGGRVASVRNGCDPMLTVSASAYKGMARAFLVSDQTQGSGSADAALRAASEPSPTVRALQGGGAAPRAFLCGVQGEGGDLCRPSERPAQTVTSTHAAAKSRAYLVEGDSAGDRCPTLRVGHDPAFTMKAAEGGRVHRAWLEQGRVVSMTPRASARFMGIPDWYVLPEKLKLASTIIGNGVPPALMRAVVLPLLLKLK